MNVINSSSRKQRRKKSQYTEAQAIKREKAELVLEQNLKSLENHQ